MEADSADARRRLLSDDGKVKRWPKREAEKQFVLYYLQSRFIRGRDYSEAEVNEVLRAWHTFDDHALLRREMFERHLLGREKDGSRYWIEQRSANPPPGLRNPD